METIIIIGGLSAGPSAATKARRINENCRIILFEKTKYISYATCGIPYYLSGTIRDRDKLLVVTKDLLEKRFNIEVKLEEEVSEILPGQHQVITNVSEYTYSKLIVATGSKPVIPRIKNLMDCDDWSNCRTIEDLDKIVKDGVLNEKKNIVILGAGLIGVETAENLKKIGKNVTLVELSPQVLPQWDSKFGYFAESVLRENGVKVMTNANLDNIIIDDARLKAVIIDGVEHHADYLMMGIGGKPNTRLLTDQGAQCLPNGALIVNEKMETTLSDIYAAGDCASIKNLQTGEHDYFPMGTHSNKGGRTAGANAAGGEETFRGAYKTAIIKIFDHTLARTGLNPRMLKMQNRIFESSMIIVGSTPGFYPDGKEMFVEIYFDPNSGKLLGAEIFGESGIDKRVDVYSTAIYGNLTVDDLTNLDLAYAPPFSPAKDPVVVSGYVAVDALNNKYDLIDSSNLFDLIKYSDKDIPVIVDVRTSEEIDDHGKISGAIHIDLDTLRENLTRLEKNKPVVIYCKRGLRGYLAAMIMVNNGYNHVSNLSGGFLAWENAGFPIEKVSSKMIAG